MDKISRYFKDRVKVLTQLKSMGVTVYPKFFVSMNLKRYKEKYSGLDNGQQVQQVQESVAGRIMSKHKFKNCTVYNLHGVGETIQIKAEAGNFNTVKHGDIVGVTGFPGKGNLGECIIYPKFLEVLSPCLHHMPYLPKDLTKFSPGNPRDSHKYLLKQEARARNRFLDLILNRDVRQIFETRSKIISYLRTFLDHLDFQEVETPILNSIPGIGAGCPFVTEYKNMKLYLRVAPEVNLKKLVVGGLDRVYEIGKQFRNEGIDSTHTPEFTSCELYMAYADYEDMMELTEKLLSGLVKELTGSFIIKCESNGEPIDVDFTPPFRRIKLLEELEKQAGMSIPMDLEGAEANEYLKAACERWGVECRPPHRTSRMLDKLVDKFLVPSCINPTFIINHPRIMSLMAKSHELKPEITERFELYVNSQELCNAYTELNDSVEQRRRFAEILKELEAGDHEATVLDEHFCEALEYGLPPSAGWGIGVDRLVMLLTYSQNIKDVILFPLMRPQTQR